MYGAEIYGNVIYSDVSIWPFAISYEIIYLESEIIPD